MGDQYYNLTTVAILSAVGYDYGESVLFQHNV